MSTTGQRCCLVSDGDRGIEVAKFGVSSHTRRNCDFVVWAGAAHQRGKTRIVGRRENRLGLAARSLGLGGPCVFAAGRRQALAGHWQPAVASRKQGRLSNQRSLQQRCFQCLMPDCCVRRRTCWGNSQLQQALVSRTTRHGSDTDTNTKGAYHRIAGLSTASIMGLYSAL